MKSTTLIVIVAAALIIFAAQIPGAPDASSAEVPQSAPVRIHQPTAIETGIGFESAQPVFTSPVFDQRNHAAC